MAIKVAPSILASNFLTLEREVEAIGKSGADYLHVDIMDGNFVPPISFGQEITKKVSSISSLPLDVHLMIANPENHFESFIEAGAKSITFHVEATNHIHRLIQGISQHGIKVGVALNPATSLSVLESILPIVDLVLIMTVNPGWGGQKFIPEMIGKLKKLKNMLPPSNRIDIQVDGGINELTGQECVSAGANNLVAGTYIFSSENYAQKVSTLKQLK